MSLIITDLETDETVAEIHDDGTIDAQDPMVEEDIDMMLEHNRAAPYRHTSYEENGGEDGDEEVINEEVTDIQPGEQGYLVAVMENLTYPYAVDQEETDPEQFVDPDIHGDDEEEVEDDE
jgi:hypothetical protein